MQPLRFSTRRTTCPKCGHKDCYATLKDTDGGKCFSCGAFIAPESGTLPDFHPTENVNKSQHSPPTEHELKKLDRTVDSTDVSASCAYLSQLAPHGEREYTDEEERAAIYEYEAGMTRDEAEEQAHVTFLYTYPKKAMSDELRRLKELSPFAGTLAQLTRPSILTDWYIGLTAGGDTLFWYMNRQGEFVNAKVIRFSKDGFHRDKETSPRFLYSSHEGFGQCLFGEQQLQEGYAQYDGTRYDSRTKVFLVESEKTAVIMSHYAPWNLWLATGGTQGLTEKKAQVLKGRKVFILYDCDEGGRKGAEHAKEVLRAAGAMAYIIDQFAFFPDATEGYDIADMILEHNSHILEDDTNG